MRFDRDLLIFKAICALYEVADACHDAPIKPTLATRFAVAFLFANSNGDRWVFDQYLETIAREPIPGHVQQEYIRSTNAHSCVWGMIDRLPKWNCPAVTATMISKVRSGKSANVVWREALKSAAELEAQRAQMAEDDRRYREELRKRKDCGYL